MTFFQQIHSQIIGIVDGASVYRLAIERIAFWEEVESTLWVVYFESRDFLSQLYNQVTTTFECLTHFFYGCLSTGISCFCGLLRYRARTWCVLALQLVDSLHQPFGTCYETNAPTGHGVCLWYTVHDDYTIVYFCELGDAFVLAYIIDMFIDFVGNDVHLRMLGQNFGQSLQFFLAIYRAGRVWWRTKNQCLGLRSDSSFELGRSNLEILIDTSCYDNRCTIGHLHHFRITYPIWSRYDDFVAWVNQYHDSVANRLLGTVGTWDLCGGIIQSVFVLQLGHDGIAKCRITRYRWISGEIVVDSLFSCFFYVVGCIEVGFSYTQVDYIYTLGFQFIALLRHGKCGRRWQAVQTIW